MIVCKLMGGLGNQMFQYAYAMALAKQFHDSICLDNSFYQGKIPTILKFNIPYHITLENCSLTDYSKAKKKEQSYHIQQKFIRSINHEKIGEKLFHRYSKKGYYFNYDPFYYSSIHSDSENKYVYGYFQGEKYFKSVETQVRNAFTLKVPLSKIADECATQIETSNAVAIHIRLGDYTKRKNKYLYVCNEQYYLNATEYVFEHIENPQFFVFTDNIRRAKDMISLPNKTVYVEGTTDYEDLILISKCKHFIISNSTFSWWGAYLSGNTTKVIAVPNKWMLGLKEEPAIYLSEMIKISY